MSKSTMNLTAGEAIFRTFEQYEVEYVFGIRVYHEYDYSKIKPIVVHNEAAASLMALGYARATNKPGVATANDGPGAVYMIPGLVTAYKSSIPVIALMDAIEPRREGKNALNEVDQLPLLRQCTKWVGDGIVPEQATWMTRHAFRVATSGRPGPVALNFHFMSVVRDSPQIETEILAERQFRTFPSMRIPPDNGRVLEAAKLLLSAERPCIVAGGGVHLSQAHDELFTLATHLNVPVATTPDGKGSFPEEHHLSVGCIGSHFGGKHGRGRVANEMVRSADVVLLVGTKCGEMETSRWSVPSQSSRIIQIDVDPAEIGRNYPVQVEILGDAKLSLEAIRAAAEAKLATRKEEVEEFVKRGMELTINWAKFVEPLMESEQTPLNPWRIVKEMQQFVNKDTIVVSDNSTPLVWATDILRVKAGMTFMAMRAPAAIGVGLPAAIGASLGAKGQKRVLCFEGDGGILEGVITEMETAARYKIPLTVAVFNNGSFNLERALMPDRGQHFDFTRLDFAKMAESLNCRGFRVEKPSEIREALSKSTSLDEPCLIDFVIDPKVVPPMAHQDK